MDSASPEFRKLVERIPPQIDREAVKSRTGAQIKKFREQLGMKQHRLARLLDIQQSSLLRWEKGESMPGLDHIIKLFEFGLKRGVIPDLLPFITDDIAWFFLTLTDVYWPLYVVVGVEDEQGNLAKLLTLVAQNGGDLRRMSRIRPRDRQTEVKMIINFPRAKDRSDAVRMRLEMKEAIRKPDWVIGEPRCSEISDLLKHLSVERELFRTREVPRG